MASNSWWLGAPGSQVCGTLVLACGIAVYKEEPSDVHTYLWSKQRQLHRENGGTLGMVPSIINPIYTIYKVGIYWVYPLLKGSLKRLKQLGYHPRVPAFSLWQLLFCIYCTFVRTYVYIPCTYINTRCFAGYCDFSSWWSTNHCHEKDRKSQNAHESSWKSWRFWASSLHGFNCLA